MSQNRDMGHPVFRHCELADVRSSGTESEPESAESQERDDQQNEGRNSKRAAPGIHGRNLFDLGSGRIGQEAELTANTIDFFACLADEGLDLAAGALAVLPSVACL